MTTVGTPVQLSSDMTVWDRIDIQVLFGNTGYVVVFPASKIRASSGSQNGLLFGVGSNLERKIYSNIRLFDLWVDATVANEGVAFECQRA